MENNLVNYYSLFQLDRAETTAALYGKLEDLMKRAQMISDILSSFICFQGSGTRGLEPEVRFKEQGSSAKKLKILTPNF